MKKTKVLSQPTNDDERELLDVTLNGKSYVEVRGEKWCVRWKRNRALTKVSELMLDKEQDEDTIVCKAAALLRLNSWWKIRFLFWLLWRWYFYVREYTEDELLPYIEECKKKLPLQGYYGAIILLTAMKTTKMQMTRAEVEHFQAEQLSAQLALSPKNTEN